LRVSSIALSGKLFLNSFYVVGLHSWKYPNLIIWSICLKIFLFISHFSCHRNKIKYLIFLILMWDFNKLISQDLYKSSNQDLYHNQ
jgi:hypothetical protein